MKRLSTKAIALVGILAIMLTSCAASNTSKTENTSWNTNYKYVFVHGLSGWGSYDFQNHFMPYWGMRGGDLMKYLNEQGFDCYSASVDPQGSAWDRACELYAQLTGSVVDYGAEHSKRCKHDRFGKDFTKKPLIEKWDSKNKINLLGHSFGGATIRLLSDLMADGSETEMNEKYDDISPLFTGGKGDWIYSITALAAPHNGTSAYESNDGEPEKISKKEQIMSNIVSKFTAPKLDGRADYDYAAYDLHIDNALDLNKSLQTQKDVYYFSIPCNSSVLQNDGTYKPNEDITESTFINSAIKMGKKIGTTENGFKITADWLENDGLVNTISATAPFGEPQTSYNKDSIKSGVWNVFDTYTGDHMSLQGGLTIKNDVKDLYTDLLTTINCL